MRILTKLQKIVKHAALAVLDIVNAPELNCISKFRGICNVD